MPNRFLLSSIFIVVLHLQGAGSEALSAQQKPPKYEAEVDLLDCDGTPCVDGVLNGVSRVRLGIDTGNVNSVVDTKIAGKAGIASRTPQPGGAQPGVVRTVIPAVQVGGVSLSNLPGLVMDLNEAIEKHEVPRVDGILAYTAFKDRQLELDFKHGKLRISGVLEDVTACDEPCGSISLITFGKEGPPIVVATGFAINGQEVRAQVDTMYTGSLLVYTASIEKLGLSKEAMTKETEKFPLTDGGVAMKVARARTETFRGTSLGGAHPEVFFPTPEVHEPDGLFEATVGVALFREIALVLNLHSMTIGIGKS
jgi:hypothetical protein